MPAEWFKITDSMPLPMLEVLVACWPEGAVSIGYWDEQDLLWVNDEAGTLHGVTHWMYLPDPPKLYSEAKKS